MINFVSFFFFIFSFLSYVFFPPFFLLLPIFLYIFLFLPFFPLCFLPFSVSLFRSWRCPCHLDATCAPSGYRSSQVRFGAKHVRGLPLICRARTEQLSSCLCCFLSYFFFVLLLKALIQSTSCEPCSGVLLIVSARAFVCQARALPARCSDRPWIPPPIALQSGDPAYAHQEACTHELRFSLYRECWVVALRTFMRCCRFKVAWSQNTSWVH